MLAFTSVWIFILSLIFTSCISRLIVRFIACIRPAREQNVISILIESTQELTSGGFLLVPHHYPIDRSQNFPTHRFNVPLFSLRGAVQRFMASWEIIGSKYSCQQYGVRYHKFTRRITSRIDCSFEIIASC